jgi:hypothetical protein
MKMFLSTTPWRLLISRHETPGHRFVVREPELEYQPNDQLPALETHLCPHRLAFHFRAPTDSVPRNPARSKIRLDD